MSSKLPLATCVQVGLLKLRQRSLVHGGQGRRNAISLQSQRRHHHIVSGCHVAHSVLGSSWWVVLVLGWWLPLLLILLSHLVI
jgi:hypothetical protein